MRVPTEYIIIGVILLLITVASLMSSTTRFVPYHADSLFPKEYSYEGFQTQNLEYNGVKDQALMDSSLGSTECQKVYGFDGLFCKPYAADNSIDIYSKASGSVTCEASGYTNSMGNLCMDANQKKLLTTRGGNVSGSDSQIGAVAYKSI